MHSRHNHFHLLVAPVPIACGWAAERRAIRGTQVMGDSSPEADKLMRSQGVRALPSFHFWKNKKQVDSVSGAKTQALQDAIEAHM